MKPGMTEKVRIGTRIAIAIAEARPGRMGWSSGCAAEMGEGKGAEGVVEDETCEEISDEEAVDEGASEECRNEGGARVSE